MPIIIYMLKEPKFPHLVAYWDPNNPFTGKKADLWRSANGVEPAPAHGATGLDLGPLHDA